MPHSAKASEELDGLHITYATARHNAGYKHRGIPYGEDTTAPKGSEKGDLFNGTMHYPHGWIGQFRMDHPEHGPLVVTLATHDPNNLGTYDPTTKEFVLSAKDIQSQTYIVSARPANASFALFESSVTQYFARAQEFTSSLNLLGHLSYLPNPKKLGDDLLSLGFSSSQIAYRIQEMNEESYRARARIGRGHLDYKSHDLARISPSDMNGSGHRGWLGSIMDRASVVKFMYTDGQNGKSSEHFPNSEMALRTVVDDWNWRVSRMWKGMSLSPNVFLRTQRALSETWRVHGVRGLVTVGVVTAVLEVSPRSVLQTLLKLGNNVSSADILETLSSVPTSIGKAVGIAIATEILTNGVKHVNNTLLRRRDSIYILNMKEKVTRDYADELADPKHIAEGRPFKKLDSQWAGQLTRLKAIDNEGATAIHMPFDDIIPSDPSKLPPHDLWLSNWYNELFGNLSRMITPNAFMIRSPSGLLSVVSNTPSEDPTFGKSNITVSYTTYIEPKGKVPKPESSYAIIRGLSKAFNEVAYRLGIIEANAGYDRPPAPAYVDAMTPLAGKVKKIIINRRDGQITSKTMEPAAALKEMIELLELEKWRTADKDRVFYGLGKPPNAVLRLGSALGMNSVDEILAIARTTKNAGAIFGLPALPAPRQAISLPAPRTMS